MSESRTGEYHCGCNMKDSESRGRNNSFLILHLETTQQAGSSKLIQNGLLAPRNKSVRRIPLMSTQKDETAVWY